jgi:6-phosphofructokinase 1
VATSIKFLKGGPRKDIYFNPDEVKAAIVTCGGLCPGLNTVIREVVMSLWYNYEVKEIYGIKWGYKGFYTDVDTNWLKLKPKDVSDIHKQGGTFLGSSRGGFDGEKIINSLLERGISQVYIIGGDGTHRGINALS